MYDSILDEDLTKWKLLNVDTGDKDFKVLGDIVKYRVISRELDITKNDTLIVVPGYSEKSVCQTIGRINYFINMLPNNFNNYKKIYIYSI
jgi:hypothetical protein